MAGAKTTPTEYGSLYELPDGLGIELHRRDYPEYNAVKECPAGLNLRDNS